jgi:hypothetical protein
MSGVLNQQMDDQHKLDIATEIALRAGILQRCDAHTDTILGTDETDFTIAYRLGNALMTQGDPLVAIFRGDRREMTDNIKAAIESSGEGCPSCAKYDRE